MALRVAVSLGVVLALMWVLHRRATKGGFGAAAKGRGRRSAAVEVVGRQGIGGKASVVVVDVEGERLVLGVSEQSVSLLRSSPTPAPEPATPLPMRPRGSARRPDRTVVPTAQQLQGSVLSADTWRQAAAALRSRRAG